MTNIHATKIPTFSARADRTHDHLECASTLALLTIAATEFNPPVVKAQHARDAGDDRRRGQQQGVPTAESKGRTCTSELYVGDRCNALRRQGKELRRQLEAEKIRYDNRTARLRSRLIANKRAYFEEVQSRSLPEGARASKAAVEPSSSSHSGEANQADMKQVTSRGGKRGGNGGHRGRKRTQPEASSVSVARQATPKKKSRTTPTNETEYDPSHMTVRQVVTEASPPEGPTSVEDARDEALLGDEGRDDSEGEPRNDDDDDEGSDADEEDQDDQDWISESDPSSPKRSSIHLLLNEEQTVYQPRGRRQRSARTKFDINWDNNFCKLVAYRKRFGNARIPQKWTEDRTLGKWASNQRYLLAKNRLVQSRYVRLEALGFWEVPVKPSPPQAR